jgi:hypothetical protein
MYPTVSLQGVKVLAKRESGMHCERDGRTFEIPFEMLWDEDDPVVGTTCEIVVRKSWAIANGHADGG